MATETSRADWLERQSRLHFQKMASLSARAVTVHEMGKVAARGNIEKQALSLGRLGTTMRTAIGKIIPGTQRVGAGKLRQGFRPVPKTQAQPGVLAKTVPAGGQSTIGTAKTMAAAPQQTSMGATVAGRGSAPTMSGATAPPRKTPIGPPGELSPELMAQAKARGGAPPMSPTDVRMHAFERARRAASSLPQAPASPVKSVARPQLGPSRELFEASQRVIQPGGAVPAPQMLTDMAKLRAAGISPDRAAEIARRSSQGLSDTSKSLGVSRVSTQLQGYDPRGIPLYMPQVKISAHALNLLIADFLDRSMLSTSMTKTASETASIDENGIVKVATSVNYWRSLRGALHLEFLGGVCEVNEDLAWAMAKNAGLVKESGITGGLAKGIGWLAGRGARGVGQAAGGVARGAQAVAGGAQRAAGAVSGAASRGAAATQRAGQAAGKWWSGAGTATPGLNPFQRGAQKAWGAAKAAPGRAAQRTREAGQGFAERVRQGYAQGREGAALRQPRAAGTTPASGGKGPYRASAGAPGQPAASSDPMAALAGRSSVPSIESSTVDVAALRRNRIPEPPKPRGTTQPTQPGGAAAGGVPKAPSSTGAAGVAVDAAQAAGGSGGQQGAQPGLLSRGLSGAGQEAQAWSKRLRTMGTVGGLGLTVGVPLLGYGALQTAQSFLQRPTAPHQYGMAAPQNWNLSHQM